jgi:hypothetical protein
MKIRACKSIVLALVLFITAIAPKAWADSAQTLEYQVKAAFIYNFIKFVDWPKEKLADSNEPVIIGIVGKDPFGDAFAPVKDKDDKGRKVTIKRFKSFQELKESKGNDQGELNQQIEAMRKCHLLFVCPSESERIPDIIASVKGHGVLTVADTQGFLEAGGVINFVMEEQKVRFEINVTTAKRTKLQIRSQLLRLAKRVVEEKDAEENKNK